MGNEQVYDLSINFIARKQCSVEAANNLCNCDNYTICLLIGVCMCVVCRLVPLKDACVIKNYALNMIVEFRSQTISAFNQFIFGNRVLTFLREFRRFCPGRSSLTTVGNGKNLWTKWLFKFLEVVVHLEHQQNKTELSEIYCDLRNSNPFIMLTDKCAGNKLHDCFFAPSLLYTEFIS